ncbi:MAG: ASCH domain-containing protein [Planctomycetaceae bacterium]
MADLLIYWRDYHRNQGLRESGSVRSWHSNSPLLADLVPHDRLWLVTSGQMLGCEPRHAAFLVEVWSVVRAERNRGDDTAYPASRYRTRVLAELDRPASSLLPVNVDGVVRPSRSRSDMPIGSLLQGPRRLSEEVAAALRASLGSGAGGASEIAPSPGTASVALARPQLPPAVNCGPIDHGPIDRERIALGIRQPWAELILRGEKTIEVRSSETRVRGPIYIYVSRQIASIPAAARAIERYQLDVDQLPRGLIVGSVEITDSRSCRPGDKDAACVPATLLRDKFSWSLAAPRRLDRPFKPRFLPYGVWFYPFRRRNQEGE